MGVTIKAVWIILILGVALASAHYDTHPRVRVISKLGATSLIIILAILLFLGWLPSNGAAVQRHLAPAVIIGLCFSFIGDAFLLKSDNDRLFIAGIVAFLLAHISYGSGMLLTLLDHQWRPGFVSFVVLSVMLPPIIIIFLRIRPGLGEMMAPVIIYTLIISTMLFLSVEVARSGRLPMGASLTLLVGALLFFISDILLAMNKFYRPLPYISYTNLLSYFSGQLLITLTL